MNHPLLRMLWWDSVAPLGNPVVPLVYWMLIGSSNCSPADRFRSSSSLTEAAPASSSSQSWVPRYTTRCSAGSSGRTSATITV